MYGRRTPKVRVTKSLLDAWLYSFKKADGYEDFLRTLNREKIQPTQAMLDGTRYENMLNNVLNGEPLYMDNEYYDVLMEMACELQGSVQQVTLFQDIMVDDQPTLLHGVLDFLIAGHIYDCKFSKTYHLNKYYWEYTAQTGMYLALVPEAKDFTYIITDGDYVYRERYPREIVPSIETTIRQFFTYLKSHELWEIYESHWSVAN